MVMYTGLARVARKTGYPVVEVKGWKRRGYGQMSGARSVMCHHTAGPRNGNYPSLGVVRDGRPGIPGPLAHYGLGRDGTIYVIAAGRANHAGKVSHTNYTNSYSIGIEAENTGRGEQWGSAQMDAYVKLCAELCKEFRLDMSRVIGHKEAAVPRGRKVDPTFNMTTFRNAVKRGYWKTPSTTSTAKTSTKKGSWFDMATPEELRKIVKEEIRIASWAYRGKANKDAWAILREIRSVVKNIRDNSKVRPWLYKGAKDPRDMHAVLKQTDRNVAAIKGTVDGLVEAVKQIDGVDPAEIGKAVNNGVSNALSSLEADVSLNINTSEETTTEAVDDE
ncbi:N-acetylmuramoyl-L-alanine amidase [Auritidibacter ignavus]|uniref:N-acetylmuramoyl-L-alanine amidase n=1 Tax=Auritidibacter ignavus TaxID=678932 RepID=UPI00244D76AB|nr:peptidoglycan recognition family protein [Auritidibacter ignavus]WGH87103.1 peptidoglycan recognition family protein [Auritidibacter ignavus]WGH89387.1 peptidoglycan recognition family protein [Auritidibacter ignavus]